LSRRLKKQSRKRELFALARRWGDCFSLLRIEFAA
jgi:hypothetical protein